MSDQSTYLSDKARARFLGKKHTSVSVKEIVKGVEQGHRLAIAKALTLIESTQPGLHHRGLEIVNALLPKAGNSIRLGITGVPGVGKSTFIEELGKLLLAKDHKIGILAIDPSSQKSKGSILGDKTRMEELTQNENVFIRPSPSSGSLGGVAKATRESITILEAAGFDHIIVETVGVGQSETLVSAMTDFFLLLMIPGAGDELQGIKRGIMEMADGIAINKAEKDNEKKAFLAKRQLENALHLYPPPESGQQPKVMLCSALENRGIDKIWKSIGAYLEKTQASGYFEENRKQQAVYWMREAIKQELESRFFGNKAVKDKLAELEKLVGDKELSPFTAAGRVVDEIFKPINER